MESIRTISFEKYAETMSLAANIYLPARCVCSNFFLEKGITPALEKKELLIAKAASAASEGPAAWTSSSNNFSKNTNNTISWDNTRQGISLISYPRWDPAEMNPLRGIPAGRFQ